MTYKIEFAGFCLQGLVRKNNEDNICCGTHYIPSADGCFAEKAERISQGMNRVILDHAEKNRIRTMGSTVTSLYFDRNGISGFNIGDSRCYRLSGGAFTQLSVDHVLSGNTAYAGYLT